MTGFRLSTDRFDIRPLFRAHWKTLSRDTDSGPVADWTARLGLLVPSLAVGGVMFGVDGRLASPTILLAADALLASGLLAVFAQLSALRLKLTEAHEEGHPVGETDKGAFDESATHVLVACFICFVNAGVLVIGMTLGPENATALRGPAAWISAALFTYTLLLAVLLVPRLLYAYTRVNRVRNDLSGFYISH
ncbi:hypothetical protein C3477_06760 [Mycobacterium kansasii]|uniref:hypothetical protein n=1 Tax=Mycobacterium kansasii TaxID=1768 RepID=UPI000CDD7B56|nr:hypothetical protein [Mycobacterium kansasii]POX90634.1 hypothetical protein C3B43_06490 [Mycobacterium kansasii]POY07660.1 hypothetical protein C3477_06760 [Mycobacterium kansasii]POY22663.1 hypothetical protein C3476_10455 [Mycobacterium kansasii]